MTEASGVVFRDRVDESEAAERYRTLAETITDGVFHLDADERFVAVNGPLLEMTGYEADELLDEHVSTLFDRADSSTLEREIERLRTTPAGGSESLEFAPATASEEEVHWALRLTLVADDGLQGVIGIARDVTERRERERALREKECRFEAIFEDPDILVGLLDPDGTVLDINQTAMEYIDADLDDVTGEPFWETPWWGEGDDVQADVEEWVERAAGGEYVEFEADLVRPDGERYALDGVFRPVTNDDGDVVSVIVSDRDVTERKERERALEESEQRYRALAEHFPNGIVTLFDHDLQYTLARGRGFERVPVGPDDLEGRHFDDVWDDTAEALAPVFQAALDGRKDSAEVSYAGREWVVYAVPITDEAGEVFAGMTMSQDITDRKAQERELRKYEKIVETVNDGIYVKDEDGRFTMVNEAYAQLTGYDREELVGEHASLVVDEDVIEQSGKVVTAGEDESSSPAMEAAIETADGDTVPAEGVFSTLRSENGKHKEVGVVRDITERKEQRRRIEESERRYRTLVENFPNGAVGLFDEDLRYTAIGGELADETEVSTEERVGEHVSEIYPAELVDEVEPYFEAALQGETNSFEFEYRDRHLFAYTLPVSDGNDEVFGGMIVVQDVTERREAERELRQQRERLTALNNLHQVALEINQALARQSSREEIEQVVCDRLVEAESYEFAWVETSDGEEVLPSMTPADWGTHSEHADSVDEDAPPDESTRESVPSSDLDVDEDAEDDTEGEQSADAIPEGGVSSAAVPIVYEGNQYGVLHISTERTDAFDREEKEVVRQLGKITGLAIVAAERERELAHERERFELLNRLIRHNLLNTLNVVEARLGLLDGHVDYEGVDHLETAQGRTAEMARLVETIRGLIRAIGNDSHDLEPVDLAAVLEDQVEQSRETFDRATYDVQRELGDSESVMADDLLGAVFENLLTNAVQHNDKDTPRVEVAVESDADTVTVHVADDGPGVPEDLRDRLFEKGEMGFDSPGSGFGLYIVREIVEAYDGSIGIEDREADGTVFSVTLPRAETPRE